MNGDAESRRAHFRFGHTQAGGTSPNGQNRTFRLDSLLTALRSVIDTHGGDAFPAANLEAAMRARGKSLTFEEEEFEDLVESKDRTFTLLSLLYPFVDLQNKKFHIDHVFPKSPLDL